MNGTSHLIIHDQIYIWFVLFFSDFEVDIWLMRIRYHNATFSQQILSTVLCVCLYHCVLVVALEYQRSGFAGFVRVFFPVMQTLDSQGKKKNISLRVSGVWTIKRQEIRETTLSGSIHKNKTEADIPLTDSWKVYFSFTCFFVKLQVCHTEAVSRWHKAP